MNERTNERTNEGMNECSSDDSKFLILVRKMCYVFRGITPPVFLALHWDG